MRIFYGTEFIENGRTIDLISIGMVAESGDEYYAIVKDDEAISRAVAHPWLRDNVMPSLPVMMSPDLLDGWWWDQAHPDWERVATRGAIAADVRQFILSFPDPQLWAWYGAYDHVVLCQLFGAMIDLPDGIPMFTNDVKQECVRLGDPQMTKQAVGEHNALADARNNLRMALALDALDRAAVQTLISVRPDRQQPRE